MPRPNFNWIIIRRPEPKVCYCGKPIVFLPGRKRHECTRCGAKFRLVVKVECYQGPELGGVGE